MNQSTETEEVQLHQTMSTSKTSTKAKARKSRGEKRSRTSFSGFQTYELEQFFKNKQYVKTAEKYLLAQKLNLSERNITIWFQNRRMRDKKKRIIKNLDSLQNEAFGNRGPQPTLIETTYVSSNHSEPNTSAVFEWTSSVYNSQCQLTNQEASKIPVYESINHHDVLEVPSITCDAAFDVLFKSVNWPNCMVIEDVTQAQLASMDSGIVSTSEALTPLASPIIPSGTQQLSEIINDAILWSSDLIGEGAFDEQMWSSFLLV